MTTRTRIDREKFTAFITKYALTKGILEKQVEWCADISVDMVSVVDAEWNEYYHGKDWHRTREAAVERARQMQTRKLDSLHDQMAKVAGLHFS